MVCFKIVHFISSEFYLNLKKNHDFCFPTMELGYLGVEPRNLNYFKAAQVSLMSVLPWRASWSLEHDGKNWR